MTANEQLSARARAKARNTQPQDRKSLPEPPADRTTPTRTKGGTRRRGPTFPCLRRTGPRGPATTAHRGAGRPRTAYATTPTASTPTPTITETTGRENASTAHPTSPSAGTTRAAVGTESSVQADALATA